ncbi:MAG: GNAT family N-acetyltransferase [Pseudomonadota bacterium]
MSDSRVADFRIRRATLDDAARLAAFAERTFDETFASFNDPDDFQLHLRRSFGEQQQSAEIANSDNVTLLVLDADELVAFAQLMQRPSPACVTVDNVIELHRIYVDKPAQGTGLAGRLMQAVRNVASEFGARHIWLGVWEHNPRAIAFYAKQGFVDVGSHPFMLGNDQQVDRVLLAPIDSGVTA